MGLVTRVAAALGERLAAFYVGEKRGDVVLTWRESRVDEDALYATRDALQDAGLEALVWGSDVVIGGAL